VKTEKIRKLDFEIARLGECRVPSPLSLSNTEGDNIVDYVSDDERILFDPTLRQCVRCREKSVTPPSLEVAGPRERVYFKPDKVKAAILTAGGLCPGLNDVIRGMVLDLHYHYCTREILGIRYGYEGLAPGSPHRPIRLTPEVVENIHREGGSMLGCSRGKQDIREMVDFIAERGINILFTIGGDGTLRGAMAISEEARRARYELAVVGVPKTIDNDISYVERSFGFETAFSIAQMALRSGHDEARGAPNGIGLVKLMGRYSGFVAAMAALASGDANFVLVPEVRFDLDGEGGFLKALQKRMADAGHALIVVAEGAGQQFFDKAGLGADASGNPKLGDIGLFLKDKIKEHFSGLGIEVNIKYIDPSYMIRSAPATATDSVFCLRLAQDAVHAAMTGRTQMIVGMWNNRFVHVPIRTAISERKQLDAEGPIWLAVMESTGQPLSMTNRP
jgi:6-phosphofructokinase 1